MSSESTFLSPEKEQHIVEAIKTAEGQTSGEIRVHIENRCSSDPLKRAEKVFHELNMDQTELQNGALLYIAVDDHKVAIYGGRDLHQKVGQDFWNSTLEKLIARFKADAFEQGIADCVKNIGKKLKEFYPYQSDDINELPDDVSYNENAD